MERTDGTRVILSITYDVLRKMDLSHEPAPLARFAPDIPAEVQRIVRKCLEKNRERRYQTIREVALDLDSCRREVEGLRQSDSQRGLQAKGEAGTTRVSACSPCCASCANRC